MKTYRICFHLGTWDNGTLDGRSTSPRNTPNARDYCNYGMDVYGRRRLVPSWVVAGGALSPHARTHHRLQHPGRWTRLEETTAFARGHGLERGGVRRCVAWDSCGRGMRLFFALLLDGSEEGRLRLGEHLQSPTRQRAQRGTPGRGRGHTRGSAPDSRPPA